jgi:hypothetical protein
MKQHSDIKYSVYVLPSWEEDMHSGFERCWGRLPSIPEPFPLQLASRVRAEQVETHPETQRA